MIQLHTRGNDTDRKHRACCTLREVLACLLHVAQDETAPIEDGSPLYVERVSLRDEEIARSSHLLREALDETDPVT